MVSLVIDRGCLDYKMTKEPKKFHRILCAFSFGLISDHLEEYEIVHRDKKMSIDLNLASAPNYLVE